MIDLEKAQITCFNTAKKREHNGGTVKVTPESMLKHCATELVEAAIAEAAFSKAKTEFYGCGDYDERIKPVVQEYEDELADVIVCILIAAECDGLDMDAAIRRCIKKNKNRAELKGDKL